MDLDYHRANYLDQPLEISVETLALCNARCTFCPYPTLERIGTKLSDETLARLCAEMGTFPEPFMFSPFKVNEPLLDIRVLPLLRQINAYISNAHLRIFTNGSTLTPSVVAEIAELSRVEHLWVSLNTHDPDEYFTIMGLRFDNTAKKLDALHTEVATGNFFHRVMVSRVSQQNFVADAQFQSLIRRRWPLFVPKLIKQDGWLGYVPPSSPEVPDRACARWFELSILATGKVSLCCMDGKGDFSIGDINTQTMLQVYNDPAYRARREAMVSRRSVHPCSTCTY